MTHPNRVVELDESPTSPTASLPPLRVLVVEDDYDAARLVSRRLAWSPLANFQVTWAADLSDGLQHLTADAYEAVILDLSLPGSEGMGTLSEVSALVPELPIVVLTGSDDDELAMQSVRTGAQDFLVKEHQDGRTVARAVLAAIERQRRLSDARAPGTASA